MLNRKIVWGLTIVMLFAFTISLEAEGSLLKGGKRAEIDWKVCVVRAKGYGVAPVDIQNEAQLVMLAREAAITVAQRRLLGEVKGVQINSRQKVKNAQVESDVIIKQIKGTVRGAQIVEEERIAENAYKVVMEVKLYGEDGVIMAVLPYLEKEKNKKLEEDEKIADELKKYTGVIINTFNLQVKPALAPKIYSPAGELIYGIAEVDRDNVIKDGLVDYERSLADAKVNSRIGTNPLIMKAKEAVGEYKTDLVLSSGDARLLKKVGEINNIFSKCKVIIVLN